MFELPDWTLMGIGHPQGCMRDGIMSATCRIR